jgi:ubiquinone/menaquinone biosynthesis C-methylase UbiE
MSNPENVEPLLKRKTSQLTRELDRRITTNKKFGDNDLDQWLIKKLNPKEGEIILDVGCGTCNHIIKFAKLTKIDYSCTGFDISENSVKEAIKKSQENGVKIRDRKSVV